MESIRLDEDELSENDFVGRMDKLKELREAKEAKEVREPK
jgi:hypothetical protein